MRSDLRAVLGRTGLEVCRLGVASSYGVPAASVEEAFERGVNYLYWGSLRRGAFGDALRNLKPRRDRMTLVLQSYSRLPALVAWSVERGLRKIGYEYADVLLLGMWNKPVSPRVMDAALETRRRGLVRFLGVSTHQRTRVPDLARESDVVHFRYNAAHPGAERDIFPHLGVDRPGMVSFTATSWGQLVRRGAAAADCYRFVLARPEVDVCMTGPRDAAQAREALRALDLGPMTAEEALRWRAGFGPRGASAPLKAGAAGE
jgi:aryl-alcohol dehydrogenase-like predicted oxidoreductase